MLNKDIYKASAYGDVPLDLFRSKEQRRDPNAQMNVQLNLDNAQTGYFAGHFANGGMGRR